MTRRGAGVIAVLAALLLSGCGHDTGAQAAGDGLPPLDRAQAAVVPAPIEQVLANGLRVVVVPRPGSSLVAIAFVTRAGSAADPPGRAGLATFATALLARGSLPGDRRHPAVDLAAAAESLGGHLLAETGPDASRIGLTVTTPKLAAALDLLAAVVRHPARSPAEAERLRARTLDRLRLDAGDPATLAAQAAAQLVHGGGLYGQPGEGTPQSVARIGGADLRAHYRRHFRPDQAALVLAGDLLPDTATALAAQVFGDWELPPAAASAAASSPAVAAPAARHRPAGRPVVQVIDLPDAGQATVYAAMPLPSRAAPGHAAGLVAAAVLGGGYSSRLNREIRIRRGLSYDAGADFAALRDAGALYASAQTRNESAAAVLDLMRAEFSRLATEPVPDEELAARKAGLLGQAQRQLDTADGLLADAVERLALGLPVAGLGSLRAAVEAVSGADVQRYARAHFAADAMRCLVVGDAQRFEAALRAAGYDVDRIAAAALELEAPALRRADSPR